MAERRLQPPPQNPESEPFHKAAAEGRFMIRRCTACGRAHWYPRALCPFCWGETAWEEATGRGTVYSYSVMRRTDPPFSIAYVTLAEGPTMLTSLVQCDLDGLRIGMPVELVWEPTEGGPPMPCFKPAEPL